MQLVQAMEDAATVDVRGAYLLPLVLDVVGTPSDPQSRRAVALLRRWVERGAHRVDRDRNGSYDDQQAVALMDAWWEPRSGGLGPTSAVVPLPKTVLLTGLGPLVDQLPQKLDDHPRLSGEGCDGDGAVGRGCRLEQVVEEAADGAHPGAAGEQGPRALVPALGVAHDELVAGLHQRQG